MSAILLTGVVHVFSRFFGLKIYPRLLNSIGVLRLVKCEMMIRSEKQHDTIYIFLYFILLTFNLL